MIKSSDNKNNNNYLIIDECYFLYKNKKKMLIKSQKSSAEYFECVYMLIFYLQQGTNKVDNKLLSFAKIIKLSKKGKGKRIKTYLIMS